MSLLQKFEAWLEANVWKFFRAIISANRDYPYHDYVAFSNDSETDNLVGEYVVGDSNINAHGDQSKRFTAKRTIIFTSDLTLTIRLNDSRNVPINPFWNIDPINGLAYLELHTNVSFVVYSLAPLKGFSMYFEGVEPDEARDAR